MKSIRGKCILQAHFGFCLAILSKKLKQNKAVGEYDIKASLSKGATDTFCQSD